MTAAMPEPDPTDWAKCEQIKNAVEKVLHLNPPNIAWMTGELANEVLSAHYSAFTMAQMELIKRGMAPDVAAEEAKTQVPLLIFQLGLQVGAEMEANRAMRELFGE